MAARGWAGLLVVALALGACAHAPPEPDRKRLLSIELKGTSALDESDVRERLATAATPWWKPLTPPAWLDEAVLESDLRRIVRIYETHGFFDAEVRDVKVTAEPGQADAVRVEITVHEGEPSKVTAQKFSGAEALDPGLRGQLEARVADLADKPFDEAEYDADKAALLELLRSRGHAEAEVQGRVVVEPARHTVAITWELTPGERYTFGRIVVAGTSKVPKRKVQALAAAAAVPGAPYSDAALADAQARVFDLGVFSMAKVSRAVPDPVTRTIPVAVDVREAPFHSLRLGFGIGVESQRQEVRGQASWTNRNLFGGLRSLSFDNRLAYVVVPSVIALFGDEGATHGVAGTSRLTFTQPDFLLELLDFQSTLQLQRDVQLAYTYDSLLAGAGVVRRFGRGFEASVSYEYQLLLLTVADRSGLQSSRAPQLASGCPAGDAVCFLRLGYLAERITWDRRDDPIRPRKGLYARLDLEQGLGPYASFAYLRLAPEVRGFISPSDRVTLGMRLRWGWMRPIAGTTTTPITQRFYGGGANDVRALGTRLLSPVQVACKTKSCAGSTNADDFRLLPVGGNDLWAASAEVRVDVWGGLGVVPFVDVGAVPYDASPGFTPHLPQFADIAVAPGLGLRYHTLFGPVRLDLAYRLPSPEATDGLPRLGPSQVVTNGPDSPYVARPTGRFDFQFSIGEAF